MEQQPKEKVYTAEEIKKLAPGYKGKPEKFDPAKIGKKVKAKTPPRGPQSRTLPPPRALELNKNPTEQKNHLMLEDSIFGVDVHVTAIRPIEEFSSTYARLPDIALQTYNQCAVDKKQLERQFTKEEMSYYATGLLWTKLIDVKAKQAKVALTTEEKAIRKATEDIEFNVPHPIATYLHQIGDYTDKMGKTTNIEVPTLPIVRVQGHGGYHADEITVNTHNLFEEIPSLGIAGDMVMSLCDEAPEPVPNFRISIPEGSRLNSNLTGRIYPIGIRRPEIKQRLASMGITTTNFPEYVSNTRFNIIYLQSISHIIGKIQTFRNERMCFPRLTSSGGETQIIVTRPTIEEPQICWTNRSVQATSSSSSTTAVIGASFMFGFQIYKEVGEGPTLTQQHANWCCLESIANNWNIPVDWIQNRNIRRNMPQGIGTERFRSLSKRQDHATYSIIRRMIKTAR